MALAFSVTKRFRQRQGIREALVEITGDASYPTGGTAIAASAVNFQAITRVLPMLPYPLADRAYIWDNTNAKLMAIVLSTGVEVANATDLSADKIVALFIGR